MQLSRSRRIGLFLGITIAGSWSLMLAFRAFGGAWDPGAARALGILYLCPPALAALFVQGPLLKGPVLEPLGLRVAFERWFPIAWLLPIAVMLLGFVVGLAWPSVEYALDMERFIEFQRDVVPADQFDAFAQHTREQSLPPLLRVILQALTMGLTFNLLVSLGEEIGFRGFLFKEMDGGFWQRSFMAGGFWALWLVPLAYRGQFHGEPGALSAGLTVAWALATSPVLTYIRIRSKSVVATAMFRGTYTALTMVPLSFTKGGPTWLMSMHGALGIAGTLLVLGALVIFDRRFSKVPITVGLGDGLSSHDSG